MPNPAIYYLTGLLLEFWRMSDRTNALRHSYSDTETYRLSSVKTIRAAKQVNHTALLRYLSKHNIPAPWEGDGGLEQ